MKIKSIKQLSESEIPEPFNALWERGEIKQARPYWIFYLVDGELYIDDVDSLEVYGKYLLRHWTQTNCCYVTNYMYAIGQKEQRQFPLVRNNGEYLFELKNTDDYEMSAISPIDGESFIVYDG